MFFRLTLAVTKPVINARSGFAEYFPSIEPMNISNKFSNVYSKGIYICDSLFENFNMGSALSIASIYRPVFLVVERTAFSYCQTGSLPGGGIYYCSYEGGLILNKVCAFKCYSETSSGQFLYYQVSNDEPFLIEICSVSECSPMGIPGNRHSPLYINSGNCSINNLNTSKCFVYQYSSFYMYNSKNFTISYSSFLSNYASYARSMYLQFSAVSMMAWIRFTNIINNNSPLANTGVVQIATGSVNISRCLFFGNQDILFYGTNCHMTVKESYIYHSGVIFNISTYTSASLITTSTSKYTETIPVTHFSTHQCNDGFYYQNEAQFITMPPSPTECVIETNSLIGSLSILKAFTFLAPVLLPN